MNPKKLFSFVITISMVALAACAPATAATSTSSNPVTTAVPTSVSATDSNVTHQPLPAAPIQA